MTQMRINFRSALAKAILTGIAAYLAQPHCLGARAQAIPQDEGASAAERLIDRISQQEAAFTERLRSHSAILETYIQEMPDAESDQVARDHYFLGRLDFGKGLNYTPMAAHSSQPASTRFLFLKSGHPSVFVPAGFGQMALLDSEAFDRTRYEIDYVHREFLGEVRCLVFDVAPRDKKAAGRFIGRIWVEDRENHIVRFNGTYTNSSNTRIYFHFDSWRILVESGVWAPAFIYVEESQPSVKSVKVPRFKAQTRLWGYNAGAVSKMSELASIAVEAEHAIDDRSESGVISPLESQRSWERQAEANIVERLEKSGLLAPPGPVDQVLNTVVDNLIATNNLNVDAKCRVLLTTPLETFSIGQTIVISRGLIDVLPDEASLAMALSAELAHIALGHRTETRFAFSDQIMLNDGELLRRLRLDRPQSEVDSASEKAVAMLAQSPYKDKLSGAGLFLKALAVRAPNLPALIRANLGNQLASPENLARMAPLEARAPELDAAKLEQIAALPLGSRVQLDPWTNRIALVKAKPVSLLSARDKLPFEVTPFMIYLSRAAGQRKEQDSGGNPPPAQRQ
jgi:hypothetical protein